MSIAIGERMPSGKFKIMTEEGAREITTEQLFAGKKVLLFSVPGAFTPTCHVKHLPGYLAQYDELKRKGIDTIACMAVNDVFVMAAWGKAVGTGDRVLLLADGSADYARALGLELDLNAAGMGMRSKRFAMVIDDGTVQQLHVEAPGEFKVSAAEQMLCEL